MADFTSDLLNRIAFAATSGVSVRVSAAVHDLVLQDGRVKSLNAGLRDALLEAGFEVVAFVDPAKPIHGLGAEQDAALREVSAFDPDLDWSRSIERLATQSATSIAVVIDNPSALLDEDPSGACAYRTMIAARDGQTAAHRPRNCVITLPTPDEQLPAMLTNCALWQEVPFMLPNQAERFRALNFLCRGFHESSALEEADLTAALERFAIATDGLSLRELEQLQSVSASTEISFTDPFAVVSARNGNQAQADWRMRRKQLEGQMETRLLEHVVGQSDAIAKVAAQIELAFDRNAADDPDTTGSAPRVILLFTGSSGVGKTELARAIARLTSGSSDGLIRIDCNTLKSAHQTAILVGAPPGYVGFNAPSLGDQILRRPASVVLFDEWERAHPDVMDLVLRIIEDGVLIRSDGTKVSFSETVILFTSNSGQPKLLKRLRGGEKLSSKQVIEAGVVNAEQTLRELNPSGAEAFLSRLGDGIVGFDVMRHEALPELVRKLDGNVQRNMTRDGRGRQIELDQAEWVEYLGRTVGAPGEWDARTVKKLVEHKLKPHVRAIRKGRVKSAVIAPDHWTERSPAAVASGV